MSALKSVFVSVIFYVTRCRNNNFNIYLIKGLKHVGIINVITQKSLPYAKESVAGDPLIRSFSFFLCTHLHFLEFSVILLQHLLYFSLFLPWRISFGRTVSVSFSVCFCVSYCNTFYFFLPLSSPNQSFR